MECCNSINQMDIAEDSKKIVLAGNPNVGKSIFFNYLTGVYVAVSNYPGTTLDINVGRYGDYSILDTPGVYGVSSFNDEEIVARDVIMSADIVLNIVDALHLDRDLFLTQQIIDLGKPVIVALNMMDEAEKNGLKIDIDILSQALGVPVVPTVATTLTGLDRVKKTLEYAQKGKSSLEHIDSENTNLENTNTLKENLKLIEQKVNNRAEAMMIMEGDQHVAARNNLQPLDLREEIYRTRRKRVNLIIEKSINESTEGGNFKVILGRLMLRPLSGIPLLLLALYGLYQFVGVFIAQTVVAITEEAFFINIYQPWISKLVTNIIPSSSLIGKLLIGEFGVLTMTVSYTLGLLLPLVAGFYFFLSLLEDSGYMPRIAALVDRMLTTLGLNGRAIIPMLLGFGCVTMATITTRLLGSNRERIIAIFLLGLAIPCSAQLGVIVGMIAPLGYKYFMLFVITIFVVYVLSGTLLNKVLPGRSTDLLIDIPPLRLPGLRNVVKKTSIKSISFVKEAGPIFALGALIITLMQESGILERIQTLVAPIITGWLQLPAEAATAFIMGIIRRDFGVAGLYSLNMTAIQTTVALITITLFVPCIAAMMVMVKERNLKEAVAIWFGSWLIAFAVGGIVAYLF